MANIIWTSQTSPSRLWAENTLPALKPSTFGKFDYFFQGSDEKTYLWNNNKWEISHIQFPQKGGTNSTTVNVSPNTNTLSPDSNASVRNIGNETNAVFEFSIPRGTPGEKGNDGTSPTVSLGEVITTTVDSASQAKVTISDSNPSASSTLNFNFEIPKGSKGDKGDDGKSPDKPTIKISNISTTTLGPTNAAQVAIADSNPSTSDADWSFTFGIPKGFDGKDGNAATIQVGTVTTLPAGSNATVVNAGTSSAAILNFGIPRGSDGTPGSSGTMTVIGKTRFVTNETDLRNAVAAHSNGSCNKVFVCDNITLTQSIDLPKSTTSLSKQFHIDLNGNVLIDGSSAGLPYLIGRKPSNQSEALNVMQSWALILENGALRGKTGTGTLVDLGSTFNSVCRNLRLENATVGIWYKFCLMSRIEQCVSTNISSESFFIDRGDWTDATNFNSQSNHSKIESCRVFNRGGNFAAYRVQGCSGIEITNSISEGADPQWHIHFNSQASTVVKDFTLRKIHLESKSTLGGVYCRVSGGIMDIDAVYSQYDNNLFVAESAGGACEMKISNVPWLTSGTKFQSIGNTKWTFTDIYDGANTFSAGRWVGGTLPTAGTCTYWNGNLRTTLVK